MERLTKRTPEGIAFLAKVKDNEQAVEGSKNTLECLYESWQQLADYEDAAESGRIIAGFCDECDKHQTESCPLCGFTVDGHLESGPNDNGYCICYVPEAAFPR